MDGATSFIIEYYDHVWLFTGMAVGTLILELAAPLFLLNRRAARLWAISTWCLHWGVYLVMGIRFRYQLAGVAFLSFFEIERIGPALSSWFQRGGRRRREGSAAADSAAS